MGVFHAYLGEHQLADYSESSIGWILGVFVFLTFFCGIFIGPLFDMHGPLYLLSGGTVCMTAGMLLLGICKGELSAYLSVHTVLSVYRILQFMLALGLLCGVGSSLLLTPAIAAVGHFFSARRGIATGIAATGGSLGGIIWPLMLERTFAQAGFPWATRIMGLVYMLCAVIATFLIRSRLKPLSTRPLFADRGFLRDRAFWLAVLGIYLMECGLFVPITYLTSFALSVNSDTTRFPYQLIPYMNVGSCLGRIAAGYVADGVGRFNAMIAALVVCGILTVAFWLPITLLDPAEVSVALLQGLSILFALTFGVASGSNISLAPVCIGQLCDTKQYGTYYATCYFFVSFGTLISIPIGGALIQAIDGGYWAVVCWTIACYICSAACFLLSRTYQVGWRVKKVV